MANVVRIGRFHFPYAGRPRDVVRGALAGAVLFGTAGAGMGISRGVAAFGLDGDAVGAMVREQWDQTWPAGILAGMAVGALLGAFLTFCAGAAFEERGSAVGVIVIATLGGVAVAGVWGTTVARHRVVTLRADPPGATQPAGWTPYFKVGNSTIELSGTVEYRLDMPMLSFMVIAGAVTGALAGRGLVGNWPRGETYARPLEAAFAVTPFAPAAPAASVHPEPARSTPPLGP
jgi:hypothetical protein